VTTQPPPSPVLLPSPHDARDGRLYRNDSGGFGGGDRAALIAALDHSLRYLRSDRAASAYARQQGRTGIPLARERASVARFRRLLLSAPNGDALRAAVAREFAFIAPPGGNAPDVQFTGYYEAVYPASRVPTVEYRYPVFAMPTGLARWPRPHPTRLALEGADGLQWRRGPLRRSAIAFLRDRLDAYLVQVQGSARLRLTDGWTLALGYAGHTDWPYTSMGMQLVRDNKIKREELTLQTLIAYFRARPDEMNVYLPRNNRFVFLRPTRGEPAHGGLGAPLTAERSVATDPAVLPPGALALIQVQVVNPVSARTLGTDLLTRYVLAQDEGSAIKGPRRVDIYMGSGAVAQERAGAINSLGRLSYLLLK
jgi:membrane-bound lytic murein transglycosylase A